MDSTGSTPIDRHCGNCVFFKFEDTDGQGTCVKNYEKDTDLEYPYCSDKACSDFISKEEQLKYFKHLLKMKEVEEVLKNSNLHSADYARREFDALSFAIDYIKTFNKL